MDRLPPRRRARKGEVAARVAVVLGLAASAGLIASGGAFEADPMPAQQNACAGWVNASLTAL